MTRRVFTIALAQIQLAQQPAAAGASGGEPAHRRQAAAADSAAASIRAFSSGPICFADTNEQMPYALFVSSKVSKDKKNPLIVSLHGLGGTQNTMVGASLWRM